MIEYNQTFKSEFEKEKFILACETDFTRTLNKVAKEVAGDDDLHIITLSGPTCSGKTTTAHTIVNYLNTVGHGVKVISVDDFYRNRTELQKEADAEGRALDLDSASSIDLDALGECIEKIFNGGTVRVPRFDFTTSSRAGWTEFSTDEYSVVMFEGIQTMYPEVTALFGKRKHKSIFISVGDDITVNGQYFDRTTLRFMRRMVRDYRFRNTAPEMTFEHWGGVVANEEKNINPHASSADITISSLLLYEPFVLKIPVLELLSRIDRTDRFRPEAEELAKKFKNIPAISPIYIPIGSVFREFIG